MTTGPRRRDEGPAAAGPSRPRGRHAGDRGARLLPQAIERGAGAARRSRSAAPSARRPIMVTVGKTEDVRIDAPFSRRHGRRSRGRRRHSAHRPRAVDPRQEDRNDAGARCTARARSLVGVFDIEVSYDVSRLSAEIRRITGGGIRVSSVNGRIMLSGTSHDAATLDKAVVIARQFAPDIINTVQVLQPQQVMLEVRFIEANAPGRPRARRSVEYASARTRSPISVRAGAGRPAARHPPGGPFQQPPLMIKRPGRSGRRQEHPRQPAADLADRRRRRASGRQRLRSASCWAP